MARVALGGLLALAIGVPNYHGSPDELRVAMLSYRGVDWERPTFERLGMFEGGMFGLLPVYLGLDGHRVRIAPGIQEFLAALPDSDVAWIANCGHLWTEDERAAVRSYLNGGGALLVLGDHTNVFGVQEGLDSLLGEYGVRFRFDSAYAEEAPLGARALAPPGTLYSKWSTPHFHGIGASLDLSGDAVPLLMLRRALSDKGEASNFVGAFLGNYARDRGERVGDLVVIAEAHAGAVCVYGDTSAFQNSALPFTYHTHVRPLLNRLASRSHRAREPWMTFGAIALLLIGLLGPTRVLWPALLIPLATIGAIEAAGGRYIAPDLSRQHVVIEEAGASDVGHYDAGGNSIGSLYQVIQQLGLAPVVSTPSHPQSYMGARAVVVVAPRSDGTADRLQSYLRAGGRWCWWPPRSGPQRTSSRSRLDTDSPCTRGSGGSNPRRSARARGRRPGFTTP
jgi:hypothetical protein